MYLLINTIFGRNDVISRHRLLRRAVLADHKLQARTRKYNGQGTYMPTRIVREDGKPIDDQEMHEACLWVEENAS